MCAKGPWPTSNSSTRWWAIVFICLVILLAFMAFVLKVQNKWVPVAFLTGGFFSALSGYFGMKTATYAGARTANAAKNSLNSGLRIAFRSGAVMGLVVVGLALLDISLWFIILRQFYPLTDGGQNLILITTTMITFGMGASTQALFARVGGGIFTKAADVGADLVGKVEADIPEDDPRNPAVIADNVGDNVGDVAGMGADLYESYCRVHPGDGGPRRLGLSGPRRPPAQGGRRPDGHRGHRHAPFHPRASSWSGRRKGPPRSSCWAPWAGASIPAPSSSSFSPLGVIKILGLPLGIWGSVVCGLVSGIVIGRATEYFTSSSYKPTMRIADNAKTGPATVIIAGLGTGMMSTAIPVLSVVVGTLLAYLFAAGFDMSNVGQGLYGIGIAAVGMLSTLGITLATDAYGPIADNAGGNAQMTGQAKEVRQRTDALDSLGNTTAATGKGFAIGSAALTALALLASYVEEIKIGLIRIGQTTIQFADGLSLETAKAAIPRFHALLQRHADEPAGPGRHLPRLHDGLLLLRRWP